MPSSGGRACIGETNKEREFLFKHAHLIAGLTLKPPGHHSEPLGYEHELYAHKFCLVLRCDGPMASRFYDAIASGAPSVRLTLSRY